MDHFQVVSPFQPQGDQPQAIDKLAAGVIEGKKFQTLMGVTGSGKTFTMAHTIARVNRPTLVISHNKTLAAQLYEEFKELFPNNAVGYFVSYYDYYQPEAYIPQRDIYIEKDASRNDDLDRLRLSATSNLVSRKDVLIVASVSCIFGLGSPVDYQKSVLPIRKEVETDRDEMLRKLIDLQYSRNDIDFKRGTFRVRGDVVELHPSYEEFAYRIEFFGDSITNIDMINPLTGELLGTHEQIFIYPAVHYVMPEDRVAGAVQSIKEELELQVMHLRGQAKLLEAQRLLARTKYDLEMIQEVGYCCWHRKLLAASGWPQARRKTVHPDRLFPEGLSAHHRRIARDASADQGDVFWRSQSQGGARRSRLPPAQRHGQSAAEI